LDGNDQLLLVSDFAIAEFASAIARHVRMRNITEPEARLAFAGFDAWTARAAQRVQADTSDISAANSLLRRLDVPLRTADALNIAITQRLGAAFATFDEKMAASAHALGATLAAA